MYIIKKRCEATEKNKNFVGIVKCYYYGKDQHLLGTSERQPTKWEVESYGYKTIYGAKKGLKSQVELCKWETERGFWKTSAEFIEV